jgi:hypothetical protein
MAEIRPRTYNFYESAAAAAAECLKKTDNQNLQKVSKDESSAIFEQKHQSCQKKTLSS